MSGGAEDAAPKGSSPEPKPEKPVDAELVLSKSVSALQEVMSRYLRYVPLVNAQMARDVAKGFAAALAIKDRAQAIAYGQKEGGESGKIGAIAGATIGRAGVAIAGSTTLSALSAAASSATLALLELKIASAIHAKSLERSTKLMGGTGSVSALQSMASAQITISREQRALENFPQLSRSFAAVTKGQIATEGLQTSMWMAIQRSTTAFQEMRADLLTIVDGTLGPTIDKLGQVGGAVADIHTALARWILRQGADAVERQKKTDMHQYWEKALDPDAIFNQPFDADDPMAPLYNPRGI